MLYDQLLQRTKAIGVASAAQANRVRILDPAEPASRPTKPEPIANLITGLLCGLAAAFAVVIGREFVDSSLRAPGESQFHLKVPELGVIPEHRRLPEPSEQSASRALNNSEQSATPVELITWQDRPSAIAESFRGALASILVSGNGMVRPHVLLLTSASRGEGKTSVTSNLGLALAEIGQTVLLLDADMRKPHLHDIFNVPNTWGLSDLLREKSPLDTCPLAAIARKTEIPNLSLLPGGPGAVSIANLLYSNRMAMLLERLRKEFDIVLIDTPPMLHIADARILGRLTDGAILIVRASKTTREAARAAKQRLVDDGIPILGTILNAWDLKASKRYGYSYYG